MELEHYLIIVWFPISKSEYVVPLDIQNTFICLHVTTHFKKYRATMRYGIMGLIMWELRIAKDNCYIYIIYLKIPRILRDEDLINRFEAISRSSIVMYLGTLFNSVGSSEIDIKDSQPGEMCFQGILWTKMRRCQHRGAFRIQYSRVFSSTERKLVANEEKKKKKSTKIQFFYSN